MKIMRLDAGTSCPVRIFACEDGGLMFRPALNVATFDYNPDGVTGIFTGNGFSLKQGAGEYSNYDYDVSYPYKTMEILKAWVIQQNLIFPQF